MGGGDRQVAGFVHPSTVRRPVVAITGLPAARAARDAPQQSTRQRRPPLSRSSGGLSRTAGASVAAASRRGSRKGAAQRSRPTRRRTRSTGRRSRGRRLRGPCIGRTSAPTWHAALLRLARSIGEIDQRADCCLPSRSRRRDLHMANIGTRAPERVSPAFVIPRARCEGGGGRSKPRGSPATNSPTIACHRSSRPWERLP